MGVRWIRLDVTWSQSEWVAELPASSRLAWVELLCYVKAFGVSGCVKKPSPAYLARIWDLSKSSIEVMFAAGFHDEALVMDGEDIIVTGWADRQSDTKAAGRMRAYRERLQQEGADREPPDVAPVTRNRPNTAPVRARATLTETGTETRTSTEKKSSPRSPPSRAAAREDVTSNGLRDEIAKSLPKARRNIVAIHGGTEDDVEIAGHRVGIGIEIKAFRELCETRTDPPHIIAAAILHIPAVSELPVPVSLARWTSDDGNPIYEQCIGHAYKEATA